MGDAHGDRELRVLLCMGDVVVDHADVQHVARLGRAAHDVDVREVVCAGVG